MRRIGTVLSVMAVGWTLAVPALATQSIPEFYDTFAEQSYDGKDGTLDFDGPWIEKGENNGPTSGFVRVWPHEYCGGGYCLKMGGSDENAAGHGAYRAVDLTGATTAMLSFEDGVQLLDDDSDGTAVVQISADGGSSWRTLDTINLDRDDGAVSFHKKYNIKDSSSSDTVIRFKITDAEDLDAYWIIDNVAIEATFETTTTTTTTTEPPKPTSTTTEPPKPTSTTTEPPEPTTTTSTTEARETTTTTHPRDKETKKPEKPEPPEETTTTTARPNTTTTSRVVTTTTKEPPAILGSGVPPADRETMMGKTALAVPAASGTTAMPASLTGDPAAGRPHIEPLAAFAAAFLTESGNYGGNLIPSVILGIVIAVVSLIGISSRKES
jgi:hypothetical protein